MLNNLMRLSEQSGDAYTMFLAPPVKECINPSCDQIGQTNSLSANHTSTDVVFDIDGPLLASKISLNVSHVPLYTTTINLDEKPKKGKGIMTMNKN